MTLLKLYALTTFLMLVHFKYLDKIVPTPGTTISGLPMIVTHCDKAAPQQRRTIPTRYVSKIDFMLSLGTTDFPSARSRLNTYF